MSARCSRCGHTVNERNLPRLPEAMVLCPRCSAPMDLPAMTVPFAGAEATPTLHATGVPGGELAPNKRYAVVVLSGSEPGKVIPIDKARITIGRVDADIVLDDAELSRQHALISISGMSASLEDLGSTNGTYVEGERIERAELADRFEFRVGHHELLFVMTDREQP